MGKIFDGSVISYTQQLNVVDEIKRDFPVTLSLALGAGHHLAVPGHRLRRDQRAVRRGGGRTGR